MTDDVADARAADPQVIPYLLYADAGAAMDWLAAERASLVTSVRDASRTIESTSNNNAPPGPSRRSILSRSADRCSGANVQ